MPNAIRRSREQVLKIGEPGNSVNGKTARYTSWSEKLNTCYIILHNVELNTFSVVKRSYRWPRWDKFEGQVTRKQETMLDYVDIVHMSYADEAKLNKLPARIQRKIFELDWDWRHEHNG